MTDKRKLINLIAVVACVVNLGACAITFILQNDPWVKIWVCGGVFLGLIVLWLVRCETPSVSVRDKLRDYDTEQLLSETQNLFRYLDAELAEQFRNARQENHQVQDILADAIEKLVNSRSFKSRNLRRQ